MATILGMDGQPVQVPGLSGSALTALVSMMSKEDGDLFLEQALCLVVKNGIRTSGFVEDAKRHSPEEVTKILRHMIMHIIVDLIKKDIVLKFEPATHKITLAGREVDAPVALFDGAGGMAIVSARVLQEEEAK